MAGAIASKYLGAYEKLNFFLSSGVVALTYIVVGIASARYLPGVSELDPATALALAALLLGGIRLWPAIGIAALIVGYAGGAEGASLVAHPFVAILTSVTGAYLLRRLNVDPIFRRKRDAFGLFVALSIVSLAAPSIQLGLALATGAPSSLAVFSATYLAMLASLLVVTPFTMRWLAKVRFRRSAYETIETLTVFGLLALLAYAQFIIELRVMLGIPVLYLIFIPLIWIALRLRPRFVTLALVMLSSFVVYGTTHALDDAAAMGVLVNAEMYLIVLAMITFIIATQEEERRVSQNTLLSQMGTLENAVAQLHSDAKSKEGFIAILAHELRNPLAPVVSTIELLQLKGARDEEEAEALSIISDRMQTMRTLLEDLLDVSHMLEGKIKLDVAPISLQECIRASVLSTKHYRDELHQEISLTMPEDPVYISGDRVRIEQVFSNLLSNASKYSHSGDTIRVRLTEAAGFAEIEVADTGVGLSPDTLESIFKPFNQAYTGEKAIRGLGIGLALVKNFVTLHGGTVRAESPGLGRGSRFVVRLPSIPAPAPTKADPSRFQRLLKESTGRSGPLILVVDDNDAAAAALGRLLERLQYGVVYAYDGQQAVDVALDRKPSMILLDIQLPKMSGYEVAKTLRERGYAGAIVALSGYGEKDSLAMHGETSVFDRYMVKPVGLAELREVLPKV